MSFVGLVDRSVIKPRDVHVCLGGVSEQFK